MTKIQNMDIQAAFVILLMLPATVKTAEGNIQFWKDTVTLTCPQKGTWFSKNSTNIGSGEKYAFLYNSKATYYCEYATTRYYFYVEGKVCENCYELDASLFMGVLTADVVATVIVMVIIYKCTKGKRSAGSVQSAKAPVPSRGRGPPVPSPDYEQLSPHTRSHDTYSLVNRTG